MTQENRIIGEKITISSEYFDELLDKAYMLHCLEELGVCYWDWYDEALRYFDES